MSERKRKTWADFRAKADATQAELAVMTAVAWCAKYHIDPVQASKMSLREFGKFVRLNTVAPTPPPQSVMWGLSYYSDKDDTEANEHEAEETQ